MSEIYTGVTWDSQPLYDNSQMSLNSSVLCETESIPLRGGFATSTQIDPGISEPLHTSQSSKLCTRGDRTHPGQPISPIPLLEMEKYFAKTREIICHTPLNFLVVIASKLEKLQ
jgi:hypothetical protein